MSYTRFIYDIYTYFNGVINSDTNTNLVILNEDIFAPNYIKALTRPFNTIEVYTSNINQYIKNIPDVNYIKTLLTEIILHELSHVDQQILFSVLYTRDYSVAASRYIDYIEDANNRNTLEFILNNREYIENTLQFSLNEEYIVRRLYEIKSDAVYTKKDNTFYLKNLEELLFKRSISDKKNVFIISDKYGTINIMENGILNYNRDINSILDQLLLNRDSFNFVEDGISLTAINQ